jgi:hypothetical protein
MLRSSFICMACVFVLPGAALAAGEDFSPKTETITLNCHSQLSNGQRAVSSGNFAIEITSHLTAKKFIPDPEKKNEYMFVPLADERPGDIRWFTDTATWRISQVDAPHSQSFAGKYQSLCIDGCAYHVRGSIDARGEFFVATKPVGKPFGIKWDVKAVRLAYPEPEYAKLSFAEFSIYNGGGHSKFFEYIDPLDSEIRESGDCNVGTN